MINRMFVASLTTKYGQSARREERMSKTGCGWIKLVLTLLAISSLQIGVAHAEDPPSHWDWRALGKVTPIKNVGNCGSVAAFAAVAAVESKILIMANLEMDLSEQQIVSCGGGVVTCGGGLPASALNYIRDNGLVNESCFPYTGTDAVCMLCSQSGRAKIEGWYYVKRGNSDLEAQANIKAAIYKDGPVVVYNRVYKEFYDYYGGIYSGHSPTNTEVGWSNLLLVGWDDTGGYWIAKNSWGSSWGESGFIRIAFNADPDLYTYPAMAVLRTDHDGDGIWDDSDLPVANAGPDQTVHAGKLTTLDGSRSSNPGANALTYLWTISNAPEGSSGQLISPGDVKPSFIPDLPGNYEITLVVTNSLGFSSAPDIVILSATNTAPVAAAGPDQTVPYIGTVQLAGTQSYDPDGDSIAYQWELIERPAGSAAVLSSAASQSPTFFADIKGTYTLSLVVSDQWTSSNPDLVVVTLPPAACESQLSAAQAEIANLTQQLAAALAQNADLSTEATNLTSQNNYLKEQVDTLTSDKVALQAQLNALSSSLSSVLTSLQAGFRREFNDPAFVIPGSTPIIQYQNLMQAILNLNHGMKQGLYKNLGGKK
jgi:hypothetical protein